eukprot:3990064-Pyramimonas_sp.AAC.1
MLATSSTAEEKKLRPFSPTPTDLALVHDPCVAIILASDCYKLKRVPDYGINGALENGRNTAATQGTEKTQGTQKHLTTSPQPLVLTNCALGLGQAPGTLDNPNRPVRPPTRRGPQASHCGPSTAPSTSPRLMAESTRPCAREQ